MHSFNKLVMLTMTLVILTFFVDVDPSILDESGVKAFIPYDYNKYELPPISNGNHVVIVAFFTLHAIRELNLQKMEMAIDFELNLVWDDNRLNDRKLNESHHVISDVTLWDLFWLPRTEVANYLQCNSKPEGLLQSSKSNLIYYPFRNTLEITLQNSCTFECKFKLANYPFDVQRCDIEVFDTEQTDAHMVMRGTVRSLYYETGPVIPPKWFLTAVKYDNCTMHEKTPCIKFIFVLKRILGHHIITDFVPSTLIVMLSWISFIVDIEHRDSRLALGLTTLLTLVTLFFSAQRDLPPVAYVKAIDVWMIVCIITVFLSLMEFALSYYVHWQWKSRHYTRRTMWVRRGSKLTQGVAVTNPCTSAKIDRYCGITIIAFFVCFVIGYWTHYYDGND